MSKPDGNTLTLWYCFVAFGVVAAILLRGSTGMPLSHSVWWTVPLCFALGSFAVSRWERAVDRRIRKMRTPLQILDLPGVGRTTRYEYGWDIYVELVGETGMPRPVLVHMPAGNDGPTARQVQLLHDLPVRYSALRLAVLGRLALDLGSGAPVETWLDGCGISVCLFADGDPEDLEIVFDTPQGCDTQVVAAVKDWQVVDVYGSD